jgi:hypothetical protein
MTRLRATCPEDGGGKAFLGELLDCGYTYAVHGCSKAQP